MQRINSKAGWWHHECTRDDSRPTETEVCQTVDTFILSVRTTTTWLVFLKLCVHKQCCQCWCSCVETLVMLPAEFHVVSRLLTVLKTDFDAIVKVPVALPLKMSKWIKSNRFIFIYTCLLPFPPCFLSFLLVSYWLLRRLLLSANRSGEAAVLVSYWLTAV